MADLKKQEAGVVLSWKNFSSQSDQEAVLREQMEAAMNAVNVSFKVVNSTIDENRFGVDPQAKSFNAAWIERLEKDIYLDEVFSIMNDWINISKKP